LIACKLLVLPYTVGKFKLGPHLLP